MDLRSADRGSTNWLLKFAFPDCLKGGIFCVHLHYLSQSVRLSFALEYRKVFSRLAMYFAVATGYVYAAEVVSIGTGYDYDTSSMKT